MWYLEACDKAEHVQTVHLLLTRGGINCETAKHLTKVCTPSKANEKPIIPEKAIFKGLLRGEDYSMQAVEKAVEKAVRKKKIHYNKILYQ